MNQIDSQLKTRLVGEAVRRGEKIRRRRRQGVSLAVVSVAAIAAVAVGLAASPGHAPRTTVRTGPQGSSSASSPSSLPHRPASSAPGTGVCQAHDLAAALTLDGEAAGHVQYRVVLRDVGARVCMMEGYARVTAVDPAGGPVEVTDPFGHVVPLSSTPLSPGHGNYLIPEPPTPSNIRVAPGRSAGFNFTYVDNQAGAQTTCPEVSRLQIQLPSGGGSIMVRAKPALSSVCQSFQVEAVTGAASFAAGS
jgi:hypothetical protein